MITGAQMKAARALAGIDQKTLADKAGISVPTVQRMEASDDVVRAKVAGSRGAGLRPTACVGESLEERRAGVSEEVVKSQMMAILDTLGMQVISKAVQLRAVLAYEPAWAIGTGKTATPEQAQSMHAYIRKLVAERAPEVANRVRIIYGGSVNPSNASQLFVMPDIDGGLVGRCSLEADEFIGICRAASEAQRV